MYAKIENNKIKSISIDIYNVSNYELLSLNEIKKLGYLPVKDIPPENQDLKIIKKEDFKKWTISSNEVVVTYNIRDMNNQEIKDYEDELKNIKREEIKAEKQRRATYNKFLENRANEIIINLENLSITDIKNLDITQDSLWNEV